MPFHRSRLHHRTRRANNARWDIQGLRAFAVLAVISHHLLGWPHGGFVGVDVFFVISGYLITACCYVSTSEPAPSRSGASTSAGSSGSSRRPCSCLPAPSSRARSCSVVRFGQMVRDVGRRCLRGQLALRPRGHGLLPGGPPPSPVPAVLVPRRRGAVLRRVALADGAGHRAGRGRRFAWGRPAAGDRHDIGVIPCLWDGHAGDPREPAVAYFSTFSRAWELGVGALVAVLGNALAIVGLPGARLLGWLGRPASSPRCSCPDGAGLPRRPGRPCRSRHRAGHRCRRRWRPAIPVAADQPGEPLPRRHLLLAVSVALPSHHLGRRVVRRRLARAGRVRRVIMAAAVYTFHLLENPVRRSAWLSGQKRPRHRPLRRPGGVDHLADTGLQDDGAGLMLVADLALVAAGRRSGPVDIDGRRPTHLRGYPDNTEAKVPAEAGGTPQRDGGLYRGQQWPRTAPGP